MVSETITYLPLCTTWAPTVIMADTSSGCSLSCNLQSDHIDVRHNLEFIFFTPIIDLYTLGYPGVMSLDKEVARTAWRNGINLKQVQYLVSVCPNPARATFCLVIHFGFEFVYVVGFHY